MWHFETESTMTTNKNKNVIQKEYDVDDLRIIIEYGDDEEPLITLASTYRWFGLPVEVTNTLRQFATAIDDNNIRARLRRRITTEIGLTIDVVETDRKTDDCKLEFFDDEYNRMIGSCWLSNLSTFLDNMDDYLNHYYTSHKDED